ncbi:MAG TPA: (Fe-S)-binding protein, partial [Myxococcaceae bacterium]
MSGGIDQHRQAYAYCAYCPKICRFACPVSESTHSETTSTWGKMTQAFLAAGGQRPLGPGGAKALYACTGCMRCRSFCKHDQEVGWALFDARELAVRGHQAPEGAKSTLATFRQHGNPFGQDLAPWVDQYRTDGPARYPLFPGCSALAKDSGAVEDALQVGRALSAPLAVCKAASRCCGYPLYAAGDQRAFEEHARGVAEALAPYPELVVLDPGCAYTFRAVYPRAGVRLSSRILTFTEVLEARLDAGPRTAPLPVAASYHDACHLGRGLGEYEQPRRLLKAAVAEVYEGTEARAEAPCAGGGGLLPRTMPET